MDKKLIASDATAIIALINIEAFSLIETFTSSVIIPKEVYDEICIDEKSKLFLDCKIKVGIVQVLPITDRVFFDRLKIRLDDGEGAAITLAIEQKLPLIIDEKRGRKIAQSLDVEIIGVIGIIKALYNGKKLTKNEVENLIHKLNESGFRVTKKLLHMILK